MPLTCLTSPLVALPLALLPALTAASSPHPNSLSSSRVVVTGAAARLELHCQALSLIEVFGADADVNADGWLDDAELLGLRDPLFDYVSRRYVLRAGSGGDGTAGEVLVGTLTELGSSLPDPDDPWSTQWVNLALEYRAPELIADLLIDVTLFAETSPDHSDSCELVWNGDEPMQTLFWMGESRRYFAPESPPAARPLLGWMELGLRHILSGWDHLAFVVALVLAAGSGRALVGVVTAFTLAHSVTLGLAALGVVHVSGRPVEIVIALSVAWVGVATLLSREPRARWREAFVFGLVHGLGFAGFLGEALYGEPRALRALLGFNLGVEVGQLLVVGVALALLAGLRAVLPPDRIPAGDGGPVRDHEPTDGGGPAPGGSPRWLAPRVVRLGVSPVIVLFALFWAGQRAGLFQNM